MPNAADTTGNVFTGGTCALLARVVGFDAQPIVKADLSAIHYTIYLLDDTTSPITRTPVAHHTAVSLSVSDVIFDTLQTDDVWTVDGVGYNFFHLINITSYAAFTTADQRYQVEYTFTHAGGQPIIVRFLITTI